MIAEMAQVLILGRKRDALEVVRALQDVGVVQIDPLDANELPRAPLAGPEADRRANLERMLARVESVIAAIGGGTPPAFDRLRTVGDLSAYLEEVGGRSDVLVHERAELEAELGVVNTYRVVARAVADLAGTLERSRRVVVLPFTAVNGDEVERVNTTLNEALPGRFVTGTKAAGAVQAGIAVVMPGDAAAAHTALTRAGVGVLRFPGRYEQLSLSEAARLMDERARTLPEELQGIHGEIDRIRREHAGTFEAARVELRDELGRFSALEASARGRYGFALRGWVPVDRKPALEAALRPLEGQVVYQYEAPDPHHTHEVPVKLSNNPIVRPFELLMGIFAPPGYGTYDPTPVLAITFPLFFGFVIGDIGLGLVSLLVAFLLRGMANAGKTLDLGPLGVKIPPVPLQAVSTILTWMSAWSIIWGVIYGELFGTLGEHLGLFYVTGEHAEGAHGVFPILLHRVSTEYAGIMLLLALIPGIIHILYGWFLRVRIGLAHGDRKHVIEGVGMFVGLVGVILYAYVFRNPGLPDGTKSTLTIIAVACLLVFLACVIMSGVFMMLIELASNGGNMLSYLRLYAVGLSSAFLANLATDAGWNLGLALGPIGILVGIIVASIIHTLAIALTIIGHVLQPLRLHYAEFFTKFGFFDHSGRPYRPFARLGGQSAGR